MPSTSRRGLSKPFVVVCVAIGVLTTLWAAIWLAAVTVSQSDDIVRTYAGVSSLRIDGSSGDIELIAEQRDDVQVTAHREWSLGEPRTEQQFDDGVLKLSGSCGFWGSFGPNGCESQFVVRVPRELAVDVRGSSGDVVARDLAGSAYLGASSGDVTAIGLSGPLRLGASSGDIEVTDYAGRDVSAHASSGDVTVRIRVVPDRVEAVASSGDVTVAVPGSARYSVQTEASSGDETVEVDQSRDSRHTIDARASSGDVQVVRLDDAP